MECGPDKCPITTFSDLTPAEQRVQRARKALEMAKRGFTQQQIAKQFGVSQSTVRDDLTLVEATNVKGQGKDTLGRKKSTGRPKTAPKQRKIEGVIEHTIKEGKPISRKKIAAEYGVGENTVSLAVAKVQGRLEAEPVITPDMLSMSAQEKLNAALRQRMRKFENECDQIVRAKIREGLESTVLPHYNEMYQKYKEVVDAHRGFMQRSTYLKILRCLHPDSRHNLSEERLAEAFRIFTGLERKLCPANEMPKPVGPEFKMPRTMAELDELRQKVSAENKIKRANWKTKQTNNHNAVSMP